MFSHNLSTKQASAFDWSRATVTSLAAKTTVHREGQRTHTRVTSQQQLLQSKQFSVFQNQTSVSASLWNFLCMYVCVCVCVLNYFSAFPEVFLSCNEVFTFKKKKKILEEVLFHAMRSYVTSHSFTSWCCPGSTTSRPPPPPAGRPGASPPHPERAAR